MLVTTAMKQVNGDAADESSATATHTGRLTHWRCSLSVRTYVIIGLSEVNLVPWTMVLCVQIQHLGGNKSSEYAFYFQINQLITFIRKHVLFLFLICIKSTWNLFNS